VSTTFATRREPDAAEAHIALRMAAVRNRLASRVRAERGAMVVAGLLVGIAATVWGLPFAAAVLLATCALVALLALIDSPPPRPQEACAWLDERLGRRSRAAAVLWQSVAAAMPPFRGRLAREAAQADDGALPPPLRRVSAGVIVAALALLGVAALADRAQRATASPGGPRDARTGVTADNGIAGPTAVLPAAHGVAIDSTPRADSSGRGTATDPPPAAPPAAGSATPASATGATDSLAALEAGAHARHPEGGRFGEPPLASPEERLLLGSQAPDGALERLRTTAGEEAGGPGAQRGEGAGTAAASRDDQARELPIAPAAIRGMRTRPREAAGGEPAASRDRFEPSPPDRFTASRSSIRPTPLAVGRWALTTAEQSYLLRWSRLRDAAQTPQPVDTPSPPGGSARSRSEGR
jgi:hypothetical protein